MFYQQEKENVITYSIITFYLFRFRDSAGIRTRSEGTGILYFIQLNYRAKNILQK